MFIQREDIAGLVEFSEWFFLAYFLILNLVYLTLNLISLVRI